MVNNSSVNNNIVININCQDPKVHQFAKPPPPSEGFNVGGFGKFGCPPPPPPPKK